MPAEFSYVGKVTPSFPFLDPRKTDLYSGGVTYWFSLVLYWHLMIKDYSIDILNWNAMQNAVKVEGMIIWFYLTLTNQNL